MVIRIQTILLALCLSYIQLDICLSNHEDAFLELPAACNETDVMIWQEDGNPKCWKCECFDGIHWGCFQGTDGNCNNAVPPRVPVFPTCSEPCGLGSLCDRPAGSVWIKEAAHENELCWCGDDGLTQCYPDSFLDSGETNYRNLNFSCSLDDAVYLNVGDAVITNCSICTCFNGTFLCLNADCDGPAPPVELQCPEDVTGTCISEGPPLCESDEDCGETAKCCTLVCQRQCVAAVITATKPGLCPDLTIPTSGLTAKCRTDYECEAHLKCCGYQSSFVCQEPYDPNDCPEGESLHLCIFQNPCESTRCPNRPEAFCRISHCGTCHAQYFVDNERVNCYDDDVCSIGTAILPCYLQEVCEPFGFNCPGAPDSQCKINYCGSCFYEYFDASNQKVACFGGDACPEGVPEFSCDHTCSDQARSECPEAEPGAILTCVPQNCGGCSFPKYLNENGTEIKCFDLEANCPEGSQAPTVCADGCSNPIWECTNPEAVTCKLNYCFGKCVTEHYNATGHQVSCYGGDLCPNGQQETNTELLCNDNCNRTACPAYPNAKCQRSSCDYQCTHKFLDPNSGERVNCSEGYVCPDENPVNPFCLPSNPPSDFILSGQCFFAQCPRNRDARCFDSTCGWCHPEFYIGDTRVNCFGDTTCATGIQEHEYCTGLCKDPYCPAFPSAVCIRDQCNGCREVYQLANGTTVDDCFTGIRCPNGSRNALCPYNLCLTSTCETHPEAECVLNHCGTCRAQFFLPNGTHVGHCSRIECQEDQLAADCADLCNGVVCPNHMEATCLVNNCDGCTTEFLTSNGTILTEEECRVDGEKEGFCPAFSLTVGDACLSDSECAPSFKCCPQFFLLVGSGGYCTMSEEFPPFSCPFGMEVYNDGQTRFEECEACVCRSSTWDCFPTKCNLTCPLEAPYSPDCKTDACTALTSYCPAYPDTRCTINPCGGCTIEYLTSSGQLVDCFDPAVLTCKDNMPIAPCEFNPCFGFCPAYPNASCQINFCGSCLADYVFEGSIIDCFEVPFCYDYGQQYQGIQEIRLESGSCMLCFCHERNSSFCFPTDCSQIDQPCLENGVEFPPLYSRRTNCTECICSVDTPGNFSCTEIPGCDDFVKEGMCPRVESTILCPEEVVHQCDHDGDCDGDQKCCHESCGSICLAPLAAGLECFSCSSFVSPDFSLTADTCSDVRLPTVTVERCTVGVPCISVRADATFYVDVSMGNTGSASLYKRGCAPTLIPNLNSTGQCSISDGEARPDIFQEVRDWISLHEGTAAIKTFYASTCYCQGNQCNHVIPPEPPTTQMPTTTTPITTSGKETTAKPCTDNSPLESNACTTCSCTTGGKFACKFDVICGKNGECEYVKEQGKIQNVACYEIWMNLSKVCLYIF
ncbi:kielin/chordin-like protein isoform X2 [Apostichopus japonicus]|uniref:kielin/chordin-like protein isoform X2 n=1 Tax=Stichopus japonicus TaxID=307972 RepID=UPI003AB1AEA6